MSFVSKTTEIIKQLTTERDGETWCPARIMWVAGSVVYFVLSGYQVYHSKTFDYVSFATGFAAIQAAGSAAVRIKLESEQPAN